MLHLSRCERALLQIATRVRLFMTTIGRSGYAIGIGRQHEQILLRYITDSGATLLAHAN